MDDDDVYSVSTESLDNEELRYHSAKRMKLSTWNPHFVAD